MWDRTDTYKNTINKMRNDTDEQLETRMRSIYNNILTQHLDMSNLNDDIKKSNYDVVIIADELAISSLVENLYKINKYYSFRNIGCYISVINTKTKLLDMHKFHI